jgi:hypothetical protein
MGRERLAAIECREQPGGVLDDLAHPNSLL